MSLKHIALLFVATATLFFISCKKEDITSDHKITSFHATLDGASWDADTSRAEINEDDDEIIILGMSSTYNVKMTLSGTGKGHFDLDDVDNQLTVQTSTNEYHYLNGSGGKVNLTLNDKVDYALSGTFAGMLVDTLLDTLLIESGEFTHIKYDDPDPGAGPGPGTSICATNMISASVGGNAIGLVFVAGTKLGTVIQVLGSNSSTLENVQLIFPENITAGTYTMDATTFLGTYTKTVGTAASNYNSVSGTLVIEEHDVTKKAIKGTFSFSAQEIGGTATKEISAGSFCAKYN